jgi:hypothetical protein
VSRNELVSNEQILRAVYSNDWDGQRIYSQAFTGPETSISRLSVLDLPAQWEIHRRFEKPPQRELDLFLEINVGGLKQLAFDYPKRTKLTTVEDPIPENQAHGLILESMSRGLAKKVIASCDRRFP